MISTADDATVERESKVADEPSKLNIRRHHFALLAFKHFLYKSFAANFWGRLERWTRISVDPIPDICREEFCIDDIILGLVIDPSSQGPFRCLISMALILVESSCVGLVL